MWVAFKGTLKVESAILENFFLTQHPQKYTPPVSAPSEAVLLGSLHFSVPVHHLTRHGESR